MDAAKVAERECVSRLRLIVGTLREPEVPPGVLLPGVLLEVLVLIRRAGLNVAPLAVEHVLATLDQLSGVRHPGFVDRI
jgi:hypothetical protein